MIPIRDGGVGGFGSCGSGGGGVHWKLVFDTAGIGASNGRGRCFTFQEYRVSLELICFIFMGANVRRTNICSSVVSDFRATCALGLRFHLVIKASVSLVSVFFVVVVGEGLGGHDFGYVVGCDK